MMSDVHLVEETRRIIREEHVSAEWALRRAVDQIRAVFNRIEDPYFRERRSDVDMIGERILRNLVGMSPPGQEEVPRGSVVFAHDLSPADITQLGTYQWWVTVTVGTYGFVLPHGSFDVFDPAEKALLTLEDEQRHIYIYFI